jgi:hypothetical protein
MRCRCSRLSAYPVPDNAPAAAPSGPIPGDRADRPEVAARAQLFQPKPRPGRRPSARRPMSRRHSFRGRQRDCTGAPVNRSSSKYLVGVGEHEPNPIDSHDNYDSRKYEFCETILRHRTDSENKAAERIMIARRLCHAGSGGQYPVPITLSISRDAATNLVR